MKSKVFSISYIFEVPMIQFSRLQCRENQDYNTSLSEQLEKHTVARDVEYNGHFGNYVYYSVCQEDISDENIKVIEDLIQIHARCRREMTVPTYDSITQLKTKGTK